MKTISNLLYVLMTLLCMSCSNFLDIKPNGRTIPKTAEELSALLQKHLNDIDQGNDRYLIGNSSQCLTWDAECGDDFETCLTKTGGKALRKYMGDIVGSSTSSYYYRDLYEIIRNCNIVLGEMKESGTEESDRIRATAYAMRAVSYYQLLRLFCETPETGNFSNQLGLPLVVTFDMEEKPVRSTMQETIYLIENDLKKSQDFHMTDEIFRFTEDIVKGYQVRLYFWTKQWDKALPLAQELLNKYPLLEGEAYTQMMTTSYDLAGNQLLKSYRAISASGSDGLTSSTTQLQFRPVSRRFLNTFTEAEKVTDIRYNLWVNTQRQTKKIFFCGMRAAEFKLIEAECYYHQNQLDKALKSINELRAHRISNYNNIKIDNLPTLPDTEIIKVDAEGNALTPLMGLILRERRKELFLEGDRFFEQKRNGSPEYWTAYDGRKYTTKKFMYTFPIPISDLEIIDGLIQNPGYTERISN